VFICLTELLFCFSPLSTQHKLSFFPAVTYSSLNPDQAYAQWQRNTITSTFRRRLTRTPRSVGTMVSICSMLTVFMLIIFLGPIPNANDGWVPARISSHHLLYILTIYPAVAAAHAQRAANRATVPPVSGPPIPQVTAAENGIYSIMAQHMANKQFSSSSESWRRPVSDSPRRVRTSYSTQFRYMLSSYSCWIEVGVAGQGQMCGQVVVNSAAVSELSIWPVHSDHL